MKKTSRAGVSDTRAGLQPAGLFSNAGIFKKGFQDFHPLDESPYLLFDAESSMLGNLENPTLDLDASKAETLDVITATRSGVATFTDQAGVIQEAEPNTVRVDWSLGYPAMLIEPSATNLITHSNSNQLNFALDNVSMTYNATSSPDGETNGILFEQTGNNANNSAYNYSTLPTTDGDYCYSVFIKAADSTKIRFRHDNGVAETQDFNPQEMASGTVAGALNLKFEDVGNGWFRVSFTRSLSSAPYHRFQIYPDRNNTQKGVYIFGLQVETGSVATSYIPTSGGSVAERTRNADNLVIDGTNFSDFYNATEGTFYIEAVHRTPTIRCGYLSGQSSNQLFLYQNNGDDSIVMFDGATSKYIANTPANELFRAAVTYNATERQLSLNGVDSSVGTHNGNWGLATELNVGQGPHSIYPAMNGYLKRVLYWPTHSSSL